jgi:L-ribulose-5-phosphate 4-epimerase
MTAVRALPTVDQACQQLVSRRAELVRYGLVVWTAGNVSARATDAAGRQVIVIKPSGVSYDDLTADSMIVCDLDGQVVDGELAPSSDTAAHPYVYRHRPDVGGIVHTHSTYACAWAARHEPFPAASPRWPTSSAAPSRSARSLSSATTRSARESLRPSTDHAPVPS